MPESSRMNESPLSFIHTQHEVGEAESDGIAAPVDSLPVSLSRLVDLLDEDERDDQYEVGPTQFAFKTAFRLVQQAEAALGEEVSSSPVVDSEGGIRVTWRRGDRQIKLVCPAANNAPLYIYQSSPTGNSLRNQNVTAPVLAERLLWLINREPTSPRPTAG